MRTIIFAYLLLGAALYGFAASGKKAPGRDNVSVSGQINLDDRYSVFITAKSRKGTGSGSISNEIILDKEGRFSWQAPVQAPVFVTMSIQPKARNRQLATNFPLYLAPGSHIRLGLNYTDSTQLTLTSGNLDNNNKALFAYFRLSVLKDLSLYKALGTGDSVKPEITSYMSAVDSLVAVLNIQNEQVKQYLAIWAFNNYQEAAYRLANGLRGSQVSENNYNSLPVSPAAVYDHELTLLFPASYRFINQYISSLADPSDRSAGLSALEKKMSILNAVFKNAAVKEWVTEGNLEEAIRRYSVKDTADFKAQTVLFSKIAGNLRNARKRDQLINDFKNLRFTREGASLPDVAFKDIHGRTVKLQSFAGKYIYIDLWASWCVPCIREIPHLKQLEKEFAGKNIVFISLSIDEDTAAWKNKVKALNLDGHQFHTGDSRFEKLMNVSAIPHFLLYSPDGRLMRYKAPRPGSKEVRDILP